MSYAAARPVLVSIVKGTTTTTKAQGLGASLVHDVTGSDRVIAAFRHFWLRASAGRRWGPATLSASIAAYDVEVVVDYPDSDDAAAIDAAMIADYEAISARLADSSLWQRPTSTIRCVGASADSAPSAPLFPFVVDDVEGGRRLRIAFPLEVTNG